MRSPRQPGREAGKEHLQKVIDLTGPDAVRKVLPDVLEADRKPDGQPRQDNVLRYVLVGQPWPGSLCCAGSAAVFGAHSDRCPVIAGQSRRQRPARSPEKPVPSPPSEGGGAAGLEPGDRQALPGSPAVSRKGVRHDQAPSFFTAGR